MQEQDTQTQMAKMDLEDVEADMPELKLKRAIKIYLERGMEEEAEMVKEQLAMLDIQKKAQLQQMYAQGQTQQGGMPPIKGAPQAPMAPMEV